MTPFRIVIYTQEYSRSNKLLQALHIAIRYKENYIIVFRTKKVQKSKKRKTWLVPNFINFLRVGFSNTLSLRGVVSLKLENGGLTDKAMFLGKEDSSNILYDINPPSVSEFRKILFSIQSIIHSNIQIDDGVTNIILDIDKVTYS